MGKNHCAVHNGNGEVVRHSLALRREDGVWVTTPVCMKCRGELIRQAKAEDKFLPFYGLEQSEAEAAKRNEDRMKFKPFLAKFSKAQKPKKKEAPEPEKAKVISKPGR